MNRTEAYDVHAVFSAFRYISVASLCFAPQAIAQFCPDTGAVHSTTDQAEGDAPLAVRCCDIDRDGDPDLITANDASDTVSVLLNNGDGTYTPKVQWSVDNDPGATAEPVDIVCCDVNGDTHVDLISVNHTSDDVSVLLNDGSLQFTLSGRYTVGEAPFGIECLNLDGDTDNDLITNGFTEDAISVLLNNGDGTFAAHVTYAGGDAPIAVVLCDVDNDSDQDVVTANMLSKDVSVLRNNSDGTFTNIGSAALCLTPQDCVNPFDITCCDLDGINGPDVATANGIADTVTVLFNDGTGGYVGLTSYGGVDGTWAVTCCDVDGDTHSDIMSANMASDDLAVFLNDGSGTLGTPLFLAVGSDSTANPSSVVCCNVDGDTDVDLVTTFVDGVTIFENDCGGCTADENCDDGNVCTDDTCVEGACQYTSNTAPCDDGDPCNVGEACLSGVCTGGAPPDCSGAGDQCNTASCDPAGAEGNCDTLTAVEDGTTCDDGLFCTETDTCSGGACVGSGDPCPGQLCDEANDGCVDCLTNADCPEGMFCGEYGVCSACPPPVVEAEGPRHFAVTLAEGVPEVGLHVKGVEPDVACVSGYVFSDGRVFEDGTKYFQPPGPDGWGTVHVRGERIMAARTFEIRADCNPDNPGTSLSEPVSDTLWPWADVDNSGGQVSIMDATKILDGFRGIFYGLAEIDVCDSDDQCGHRPPYYECDLDVHLCKYITLEAVDIIGAGYDQCCPDGVAAIIDVVACLDAFRGFPDPCGVTCP